MIEISDFSSCFKLLVLIFRIYFYVSIFILPFVLFNSYFGTTYKPNFNYSRKKAWYHYLKFLWALPAVTKYKEGFSKIIKNESKELLEEPRKLTAFMKSDTQSIYGVDANGNCVYIRITLREKRLAESFIYIRLADGQIFQQPEQPLVPLSSIPRRRWQARGLQMCIVEPFSVVSITYSGFLQHIKYEQEDQIKHVSFQFTWTASSKARFFPQEVSTTALAEAVAREPWRDAKWIKMLGSEMGYEQHGSMHGTINESGSSSWSLRLRGCRRRAWGPRHPPTITMFGALNSQSRAFNLTLRSYQQGCKLIPTGSVHLPDRAVLSIAQCEVVIPNCVQYGIIPPVFRFKFTAGGVVYTGSAFPLKMTPVDMRNEENQGYDSRLVQVRFMLNGEEASGMAIFSQSYKGKGIEHPPYIIRDGVQTLLAERPLVVPLRNPECCSQELAGRGTRLHLLTNLQTNTFNTLDGFCILTPALDEFLESNLNIKEELSKLKDVACGVTKGNLQEMCDRVGQLIENTVWPVYLQELVFQEMRILQPCGASACWAVRSMGYCALDAFTDRQVLFAVTRAWAHNYQHSQVQHRRLRGMDVLNKVAVVVQPTLNADMAGVLFSADPDTGNLSHMHLKANYGLGISIITNSPISDKAIISRTWDNQITICNTETGTKNHKIVISEKGIMKVENNNKNNFCLNKEQILQIAKAGLEIEQALGKPVKIEWAFYKDQLYILDACVLDKGNVSFSFHSEYNYPLISETDKIVFECADNLFPINERVSALAMTTTVRYLDAALQHIYDGQYTQYAGFRKLAVMNGIVGTDIFQTILRYTDKLVSDELKIHVLLMTGQNVLDEILIKEAISRNKVTKWSRMLFNLVRTSYWCWTSMECCEEAQALSQAMRPTPTLNTTAAEHCVVLKRNLPLLERLLHLHTIVNHACFFYQKLFFNLLHDHPADINIYDVQKLMSAYSEDVISELDLVAAVLRSRGLDVMFLSLETEMVEPWLEQHAPDILPLLHHIFDSLGPVALHQYDFISDPWERNMDALICIIQKIIQKMNQENKTDNEILKGITKLTQRLENKSSGKFTRWLDARLYNSFHQRSKIMEAITVTINKFRRSYLELACKLVKEGKIPDQKLIYFFTQCEIELIVQNNQPDLVEKAIHRAIEHKNLNPNVSDYFTSATLPTMKNSPDKLRATSLTVEQQHISGTAVVGGHVVGRICVLENFKQVERLQPGDILITKSLDIGWSPVLGVISGWVCETGNFISQGSVAVCKRNLPCILANGASQIFKTGDMAILSADIQTINGSLQKVI